jgi:hypothetical protein
MRAEYNQNKEVAETRLQFLKQDQLILEAKKKRLEEEEAELILKLVATREQILSAREQDE